MRARLLARWVEADAENYARRPSVFDDYLPLSGVDVTTTPAENLPIDIPLVLVEGEWDDLVFTNLLADTNYTTAVVIWDSAGLVKLPDAIMSNAELLALRNFLVNRFGLNQQRLTNAFQSIAGDITREQVANRLITMLRNRQRA